MAEELLELVNAELLPVIGPLGFTVVQSETADAFDNASVVLQAPALRIRVVRERSQVFIDVGPASEPGTWFDSAVVIDYLGISPKAGFHDRDASGVLRGAGAFITAMWRELTTKFGLQRLAATKKDLISLRDERAAKLFDR